MIMTATLMAWTSIGFALSLLYVNTTYATAAALTQTAAIMTESVAVIIAIGLND